MTERRQGPKRDSQQGGHPGASPDRADTEDPLLGLQGLAGNRAVADLLAARRPADPAGSAGIRVRDVLRGVGGDAGAVVQRVQVDEKEVGTWDAKAAYQGKEAEAEKAAWEEQLPSAEKDVGTGGDAKAAYAKGYADGEKAAGGEKGYGEKATSPGAGRPMLAVGSAGPSVTRLQALLVDAGYAVTPDGSFGPRTRAAVVRFQAASGLAADGIVGPMTWGSLEAPGAGTAKAGMAVPVSPGEMELVGPGAPMEKSAPSGAGEAALPEGSPLEKKWLG